jgi:hypothetical protein
MLVKKIVSAGLLTIAVTMLGIVLAPSLHAQTTPTTEQCTLAKTRLDTRITKVDTVRDAQSKVYTGLQTKLEAIITSATEAGYDKDGLAALSSAQDSVTTKITAYTEASAAYKTALAAAKDTTCSTTNLEFRTAVIAARASLASLHAAAKDVRVAFRTEAIPALKAYAAWLR